MYVVRYVDTHAYAGRPIAYVQKGVLLSDCMIHVCTATERSISPELPPMMCRDA